MSIYYVDGAFVRDDLAVLPVNDLSILRGYGVFDYLRTYNKRPFKLKQNIARLRNSAALIGMDLPWDDDELYDTVMQTLERNPEQKESNIRIVVTGGISPDNIMPTDMPSLVVMVTPLHELPDWWYTQGVKVITYATERYIPGAKSINYIPAILALKQAKQNDAIEALYVNEAGYVTEGTTTNVFAFYGTTMVTPGIDILPGITRGTVLELAKTVFDIEIRDLTRDELLQADEVMITAANKQIVPVIQIDDTTIGAGIVGERVQRIMALFREETQKAASRV